MGRLMLGGTGWSRGRSSPGGTAMAAGLGFFERLARGWAITKASWTVLERHPKLVFFPIVSGVAFLALMSLIGLAAISPSGEAFIHRYLEAPESTDATAPLFYAALFAFYVLCAFVMIFFNAALIFCALAAFAGEKPSIRAGLAAAMGRFPQILAWALIATTVGVILMAIQSLLKERLGWLAGVLGGLLEFTWGVLTYFVIPVLVVENAGPIEAIKRSSAHLKKTWGETLAGEGGMAIIAYILFIPILILPVCGILAGSAGTPPGLAAGVWLALGVLGAIYALVLMIVFAALGAIFRAATYLYATTGQAPASMDEQLLKRAFTPKLAPG